MIRLAKPLFPLIGISLFLASCAALPERTTQQSDIVDERELIVLTSGPAKPLIDAAQARGYTLRAVHPLQALDDVLVTFEIPGTRSIPDAIAEIETALPEVTAGAHHLYRIQSDAAKGRGYAEPLIGWPEGGCAAAHRVGVIDAGVPATHPAMQDGRIVQQQFVTGNATPATNHGALMADLLVGQGKLRGGRLFSANVIDPSVPGPSAAGVVSILRGMNWMHENEVKIVNISLAGPRNKLMNRALGRAAADGMIIVAAAGNAGATAPPQFPAAFPFTIAVTAVDNEMAIYEKAVRGAHIDFAAPGVDVLVQSDTGVRIVNGTSVAAPFVTAILAATPRLSSLDADAVRRQLAANTVDLGQPGKDRVFGTGLILAGLSCQS